MGGADHDTLRINLVDDTLAFRHDRGTTVAGHNFFDTGAHKWGLGLQKWHRLTHHVRAHQGPVRVIVFQERDQGRGDRDKLLWRHVDQVDILTWGKRVIAVLAGRDQLVAERPVVVHMRVGLRHGVPHFLGRRHVLHVVGDLAVHNLAIRCFDKAVFVHAGKGRQRVDQTNVRAFGCFNRTHTTVVGRVHVAHLEAGALAGQTTWAQCRETTLVRDFRQRVGLVHELRQLRRAKEFTHSRRRRFCVDQVLRHHGVDFDAGHAFLDRALHAQQANTVLVFHQLAHRTDAAVSKVVDIVDIAVAIAQFNQRLDARYDVFTAQGADRVIGVQIKTHVHFHAPDSGQVIAFAIKEQGVEQACSRINGWWLARTHHAVDIHQRGFAVQVFVSRHCVAHIAAHIDVIDVEHGN